MSPELVTSPSRPTGSEVSADSRPRLAWYAAVGRWAPSKHNSQPWRFDVREQALDLWADPIRTLTSTDPHRREMVISCGAAVEFACVAARVHGYQPEVSLLPDGVGGCLARLVEVGPWQPRELDGLMLNAVSSRRTDRGPLDSSALPADLPFLLQAAAADQGAALRMVSTPGDRSTLAHLVERADRLLVRRRDAEQELAGWLREPGDPRRDGVPTDHTRGAAASYRAEFVQRDFSSEGSHPAQDRPGRDRPLVGVLCTPSDGVADWLVAGRGLASVLLRAAVAGANASYLNQPVEETAIRVQLGDQLALPGVAQLVLRVGVGGPVSPPPRRLLSDLSG
ncbi:MAG: hypothetical protein M3Z02_01935 [Actinomycetota bacterium]|nr:hypothetical protein [Actinomycetota bacterium]